MEAHVGEMIAGIGGLLAAVAIAVLWVLPSVRRRISPMPNYTFGAGILGFLVVGTNLILHAKGHSSPLFGRVSLLMMALLLVANWVDRRAQRKGPSQDGGSGQH